MTGGLVAVSYFGIVAAAVMAADPGVSKTVDGKINVGLIVPLTRQDRVTVNPWGVQQKNGFELSLEGARHVNWELLDNSESALDAREKAIAFLGKGVDLIAGLSYSDQAMAVKQVAEPARIPYLTVFGTSENLFDKDKTVFSMAMPNDGQAGRIAGYLATSAKLRKSGIGLIVARNCEYCVDMERELKSALEKAAIPVTQYPDILKNRPLPHDYFDKMEPKKVLAVLAYEIEGMSVLNALTKRGFRGILVGGDTWSAQTRQVGANLGLIKEICLVNPVPYDATATTSENLHFVAEYRRRFGEAPTDVAALAYDAGKAIGIAADKCVKGSNGTDKRRSCMADQLATVRFLGVSGEVKFSQRGKRLDPGILLKSSTCVAMEKNYGLH